MVAKASSRHIHGSPLEQIDHRLRRHYVHIDLRQLSLDLWEVFVQIGAKAYIRFQVIVAIISHPTIQIIVFILEFAEQCSRGRHMWANGCLIGESEQSVVAGRKIIDEWLVEWFLTLQLLNDEEKCELEVFTQMILKLLRKLSVRFVRVLRMEQRWSSFEKVLVC